MKKLFLFLAVAAIALTAYWYVRSDEQQTTQEIQTVEVSRGDIIRSVATSGAVRALVTVEVGSQLSGQILQLFADFNTEVKTGQLIAQLDPQTFETRVRQSQADLKAATANVALQNATITRAESNLRKAKRDYERQKPLVDKGTVAQTVLDASEAAFESAEAELQMAQAQLHSAEATVDQRRASLSAAEIDLERTQIRSPIDGVVIERSVDVGQTVAASLSSPILFKIAQDLRQIQVEANADEADIGNIKEGDAVTFTVDAFPDDEFTGRVQQIRLSPIEGQSVVTYTVIISATNPKLKLLPGMTANLEITTGKREKVLRVSNDALRFRPVNASPDSKASASRAPGGGPGGNPLQRLRTALEKLGLTEEQIKPIEAAMMEQFKLVRSEMAAGGASPGGFDRDAMRLRLQNMQDEVLQQFLDPQQLERFRRQRAQFEEVRQGTVWVPTKSGEPEAKTVMLGISDDAYTEVLGGDVTEGMQVITRVREKRM